MAASLPVDFEQTAIIMLEWRRIFDHL